jgi:hypothetical protein
VALNTKLEKLFLQNLNEKKEHLFGYPFADMRLDENFKNGKPNGGIIYIIMMLSMVGLSLYC